MTRAIFLNGPPGCGKDFAAALLKEELRGETWADKFGRILKERCHAAFGLVDDVELPRQHDHYEKTKDVPSRDFLGLSPRAAYISFSETWMKPAFGNDIFGKLLMRQLTDAEVTAGCDTLVISDSGFKEEALVLVDAFGARNCVLVQIEREGCNFALDSRNYINLTPYGVLPRRVINPGTPDGFLSALKHCLPELPWKIPRAESCSER